MTCIHCLDSDKFFDAKGALKELRHYYKKGPTGTAKALLEALSKLNKEDKTLLDIGGGIGVLQWEFLKQGAKSTTDIDASVGYLDLVGSLAKEYKYESQTTFLVGDFNDFNDQLTSFDFITLDKVVCCYPDYELILNNASQKTDQYLALSFPISNVISRSINLFVRLYFKIKKSEFRTYIHPSKKMKSLIKNAGFEEVHSGISFPWHIKVYKKL